MASLTESKTFQSLNKSSNITTKVAKLISTGVSLDKSYIEEQYLQIQKTRISPIADKVLKAFDEGRIRLIWNKNAHLTIAVPFIVVNIGGHPTGCIFISDFSSINKDDTALTIEMKKLYVLMESAYVAMHYYTTPGKFTKNGTFMKTNAQIYSSMVLRILNRDYALSLDKDAYDTANYAASRFFLEKVMGLSNKELSNSYAVSTCNAPSSTNITLSEDLYDVSNIENIENLVTFFGKTNTKMGDLKYRYFFERWIASFGTGACLSIDAYPYFYYVISNVIIGGFLVSVSSLSEIVKNAKGIGAFYSEITRLV